ncbi:hypothetical protein [Verrucomicrobium sp. BvORR106]|uniref:hypothetical protein n=1 Tax=Verrucomicrobium sp. BvORR106 TaxID=1403819 RepID=UPI00056E11B1|nr:hypothetical protein [Verrucomicrobium sp. BvORR106]
MNRDLETLRGKIFFWLGIVVFPVFWVWWMNRRQFAKHQIHTAQVWAVVYALAVLAAWVMIPDANDRLCATAWWFSRITFNVGVVLWIWLVIRVIPFYQIVVCAIVLVDVIAILSSQASPWMAKLPPDPWSLLYILIPATLHLLVEPVQCLLGRFEETQD